jgi:hypothetical protein
VPVMVVEGGGRRDLAKCDVIWALHVVHEHVAQKMTWQSATSLT